MRKSVGTNSVFWLLNPVGLQLVASPLLYRFQFISEMVFQVPLFGGVESEFKADEEMVFVVLEVVDGCGGDVDVETEEALLVRIADQNDFVLRELGLGYDGIVEHEALLE